MKKFIIIFVVIIVSLIAFWFITNKKSHTVADFDIYPCEISLADQIEIQSLGRTVVLSRENSPWHIIRPHDEPMDDGARQQLEILMKKKLYIDEKRPLDEMTRKDFSHDTPTVINFIYRSQSLCTFELGKGFKLPTVNSERRWIFDTQKKMAFRIFVPLLDFGLLLEQPVAGWRQKKWFDSSSPVQRIELQTSAESYILDTQGSKSDQNAAGWQMVSASYQQTPIDLTNFELDVRRVDTVLNLISPLYIDDWAYDLDEDELKNIYFGGKLIFRTNNIDHTLEIGSEADLSKHPEWMTFGEGTRYVRFDESKKIAIMRPQRILGVFPTFDDMRTKNVYHLDSAKFSAIEIAQGDICFRMVPISQQNWGYRPCSEPDAQPTEISSHDLAIFTKTLVSLQAVRYITSAERKQAQDMLANPDAQIRIYEGPDMQLVTALNLSAPLKSLFRYAQVVDNSTDSPIFVLTEGLAAILLHTAK